MENMEQQKVTDLSETGPFENSPDKNVKNVISLSNERNETDLNEDSFHQELESEIPETQEIVEGSVEDELPENSHSMNTKECLKIEPVDFDNEELLLVILENHENDLLLFIKDEECGQSKQMQFILETHSGEESEINMEVIDVNTLTSENSPDFYEAVKMFTRCDPPVLVNRRQYFITFADIVNAYRFCRLDLIIEPPIYPYYNIVIVGCGLSALTIIEELKKVLTPQKVAVVEWTSGVPCGSDILGGLRGNRLRKLIHSAIEHVKKFVEGHDTATKRKEKEISYGEIADNWAEAMRLINDQILQYNEHFRRTLGSRHIDFYRGSMEFVSRDTLRITLEDDDSYSNLPTDTNIEGEGDITMGQGIKKLIGMNFIICGGTIPYELRWERRFSGIENCFSVEQYLFQCCYPQNILIIGNTPEIFEFAYLLALCGGEITIMTVATEWLPKYDKESVEKIIESFEDYKVNFVMIKRILSIEDTPSGYKAIFQLENRVVLERTYLAVVGDFNRIPISCVLSLQNAGVELDHSTQKIIVNHTFKSVNPAIWAFGDVAHGHSESEEFEINAGKRVISLMLNEIDCVIKPTINPQVLIAPLEYAFFYETEELVKIKFCEDIFTYEYESRPISYSETESFKPPYQVKIVCMNSAECPHGSQSERLIGLHFLGENASSLITSFAMSLKKGLTKRQMIEQWSIMEYTNLELISDTASESKKEKCMLSLPSANQTIRIPPLWDFNYEQEASTTNTETPMHRWSSYGSLRSSFISKFTPCTSQQVESFISDNISEKETDINILPINPSTYSAHSFIQLNSMSSGEPADDTPDANAFRFLALMYILPPFISNAFSFRSIQEELLVSISVPSSSMSVCYYPHNITEQERDQEVFFSEEEGQLGIDDLRIISSEELLDSTIDLNSGNETDSSSEDQPDDRGVKDQQPTP